MNFDTPILLVVYKRPDTTRKVFEVLTRLKPSRLYVAADGFNKNNLYEKERCEETIKIVSKVNWKCQIKTDFSQTNLGLRRRMVSAINWFFSNEDKGIILEDDCVAHPTFFKFCEELLDKYKDDERVMAVSGNNFQFNKKRTNYSYYFSRFPHCWGWASWRRAWEYYDDDMELWQEIKKGDWLKDILGNKLSELYWRRIYDLVNEGKINSWAYRWQYSCWLQNGLTILPNINLVSNIGFGKNSTHTKIKDRTTNIPSYPMQFPLKHPPYMVRDSRADFLSERDNVLKPTVIGGLIYRSILRKLL
jgi:hypothetical protein